MKNYNLTEEEILKNWNALMELIEMFPQPRKDLIKSMYKHFEQRMSVSPASTNPYYHNAFFGGYVDHILRVVDYAIKNYKHWKDIGMDVQGFTMEELIFSALNHDLGKMGFSNNEAEYYLPNDNNWEIEKRHKHFKVNTELPYMTLADMSLYLLQEFNIKCTFNEWHCIRVHDGPYEESNKPYYISFMLDSKFKTNLPYIIHYADLMAMRFEYQRFINLNK